MTELSEKLRNEPHYICKIETLYTFIKHELMLRDQTAEELFQATNLSPSTLSNLRKARPRRSTYDLLAEYFDIDVIDLFLLPITREEIYEMDEEDHRFESKYDFVGYALESRILPLPKGETLAVHRKFKELLQLREEIEGFDLSDEELYEFAQGKRITFEKDEE